MAHARPPPSRRGRLASGCVGVAVALSSSCVGIGVLALRFESAPPALISVVAVGALLAVGVPMALLLG